MPLFNDPLMSEFENEELRRRIRELEEKLARLEEAISVDPAGQVTITSPNLQVDAPMARFSGVVQCDTIIANSVVGSSYTPGAGNVM